MSSNSATRQPRWFTKGVLASLVTILDAAVILVVGLLAYGIYLSPRDSLDSTWYLTISAMAALMFVTLASRAGLYRFDAIARLRRQIFPIISLWCSTLALLLVLGFLLKISADYSRAWAILWALSVVVILVLSRVCLRYIIHRARQHDLFRERVVLVGTPAAAALYADYLKDSQDDLIILARFYPTATADGLALADLPAFARKTRVDKVVLTLPWSDEQTLAELMPIVQQLPVEVSLAPEALALKLGLHNFSMVGNHVTLKILDRPLKPHQVLIKDLFDKIAAAGALALLSPLLLMVAAAIKLDSPGPVLFKQKRLGFNNKTFRLYKFRSMYHDQTDTHARQLTTADDPRVTRVGRFIRRTSIDELPQLLNVLQGDMALVGPRPHALQAKAAGRLYGDIVEEYANRHRVKPGITGWAQVNGWRGETDTEEKILQRIAHDLYYIDHWSLWLDIKILILTVWIVVTRKNAY